MAGRVLPIGLAAALSIALVAEAKADAIDGEWCRAGQSFKIDGPTIVTPGGTRMQGVYDRHGFDYVIPPGEPGAGTKVTMSLWSDDDLKVTPGDAPTQDWRRCRPATS